MSTEHCIVKRAGGVYANPAQDIALPTLTTAFSRVAACLSVSTTPSSCAPCAGFLSIKHKIVSHDGLSARTASNLQMSGDAEILPETL